jgi:uncharacterized protein YcbX
MKTPITKNDRACLNQGTQTTLEPSISGELAKGGTYMLEIGRVLEVWRYPVSSVGGEMSDALRLSPGGVAGDRLFGLYDRASRCPAAPEQEPRWRAALNLSSVLCDRPLPGLRFPERGPIALDDPCLPQHLTEYFRFDVGIAAHSGSMQSTEMRLPVIAPRYAVSPLHLLTTASLRALETMTGIASIDRRRFRPSVLIETDGEVFIENDWVGQTLTIGRVEVTVSERTRRCGMTLVSQPGLEEEPNVLRAIMRHNARSLGVYATPRGSGSISVGDRVYAGT